MLKMLMVSTAALAMASTVPLSAQQHQHGHDMPRNTSNFMMMEDPGFMVMHQLWQLQPSVLLQVANRLDLSAGQIEELRALEEGVKTARQEHMQAAMASHQGALTALLQDGHEDRRAYASAMEEAASHMALAQIALANAALDAGALLSEEQRSRVQLATEMSSVTQKRMREMCASVMASGGMPHHIRDGEPRQHRHN